MDQKSRLDDLPRNDDKDFWGDAEIHGNLTPTPVVTDSGHYFVRVAGHQAQCTHCEWGFQLDPGDRVRDGHLYDKLGKLVI